MRFLSSVRANVRVIWPPLVTVLSAREIQRAQLFLGLEWRRIGKAHYDFLNFRQSAVRPDR